MTAAELCVPLKWDSVFFGVSIGRLLPSTLSSTDITSAVDWARARRVACLYALVATEDTASRRALESSRFRAIDERLTLARALPSPLLPHDARVRVATKADIPALAALARVSHHNTRFYADGHFARERCDALYATWITQSVGSGNDQVLVAADGDGLVGYLSVQQLGARVARIGLVAVAERHQGKGFGRALLEAGLQVAAASGAQEIAVVTQGTNPGAVAYYTAAGFAPTGSETWYHGWFDTAS
jgi:ribosomal protein S18 acetylase RimI-like enzyme